MERHKNMKLTNRWNRFIYRLWSPVYDGLFDRFFAAAGRRRALEVLNPQPGERILLVGVGTGADLPLLPDGAFVVGIDLSPHMLAHARPRLSARAMNGALIQGDAQTLPIRPGAFDCVVLNLVLSVVPDGAACLRSALWVLRPAGRVVVFDKFLPAHDPLTLGRRLLNSITTLFGTDITRRFQDLAAGSRSAVAHEEPGLLWGAYRILLVRPELTLDLDNEPDPSTFGIHSKIAQAHAGQKYEKES
jgi:SAM-dependent methyltransferase